MNPAFVSSASPLVQPLFTGSVSPSRCTTCNVVTMSLGKRGGGSPFGGWGADRKRGFSGGSGAGGGHSSSGGGSMGSGKGPRRSSGGGGAAGSSGNPFVAIWSAYCARLAENPITTKAFTSLIGFFLGDLIAQKFLGEKDADIDKGRLARMASFGFLIHGPTGHYFYNALDRLIVGTSPLKVVSKVAIDQIMWAPVFTTLFFAYLGFAERKSVEEVVKKIKNDTWLGVTTSWKFWPAAHAINFAFIPTAQRLLYINCLQVGYNVILSIIGNK